MLDHLTLRVLVIAMILIASTGLIVNLVMLGGDFRRKKFLTNPTDDERLALGRAISQGIVFAICQFLLAFLGVLNISFLNSVLPSSPETAVTFFIISLSVRVTLSLLLTYTASKVSENDTVFVFSAIGISYILIH